MPLLACGKAVMMAPKSVRTGDTKKRKRSKASFSMYIYNILKHVHPDLAITKTSMDILLRLLIRIFEKISRVSAHLAEVNSRSTLTAYEVHNAVCLLFPGELAKFAVFHASVRYTNETEIIWPLTQPGSRQKGSLYKVYLPS